MFNILINFRYCLLVTRFTFWYLSVTIFFKTTVWNEQAQIFCREREHPTDRFVQAKAKRQTLLGTSLPQISKNNIYLHYVCEVRRLALASELQFHSLNLLFCDFYVAVVVVTAQGPLMTSFFYVRETIIFFSDKCKWCGKNDWMKEMRANSGKVSVSI